MAAAHSCLEVSRTRRASLCCVCRRKVTHLSEPWAQHIPWVITHPRVLAAVTGGARGPMLPWRRSPLFVSRVPNSISSSESSSFQCQGQAEVWERGGGWRWLSLWHRIIASLPQAAVPSTEASQGKPHCHPRPPAPPPPPSPPTLSLPSPQPPRAPDPRPARYPGANNERT